MSRPTNQELCDEFRKLLTDGFYCVNDNGDRFFPSAMVPKLEETKAWRGDLWKAFRELENRLCPTPELMRKENGNG